MDDGFQVTFFGGDQRKALFQIKAHLIAEYADGAGASAVALFCAVIEHMFHQI